MSITLIDGDQQQEKETSHRHRNWCTGKYLISIGIPTIIVIIIIILILLFREKNRRCGIFINSNRSICIVDSIKDLFYIVRIILLNLFKTKSNEINLN